MYTKYKKKILGERILKIPSIFTPPQKKLTFLSGQGSSPLEDMSAKNVSFFSTARFSYNIRK